MVGHENDGLPGHRWIAAGERSEDIARVALADIAGKLHGEMDAERDGPEVASFGGGAESVQIVAAQRSDPLRCILSQPTPHLQPWAGSLFEFEFLAGPGVLHDLIWIPC